MRPTVTHLFAFVLVTLAGCTDLDTHSPTAMDLSGTWRLDASRSDQAVLPSRHEGSEDRGTVSPDGSPPRFGGPMPLLPMITATQMKIDQDATSMGIEYPGSPYRDLKWGTQKRGLFTIDAGWNEKQQLIVITKSDPLNVREIYTRPDADTLVLQIDLQGKHIDTRHMTRVFTRQADSSG